MTVDASLVPIITAIVGSFVTAITTILSAIIVFRRQTTRIRVDGEKRMAEIRTEFAGKTDALQLKLDESKRVDKMTDAIIKQGEGVDKLVESIDKNTEATNKLITKVDGGNTVIGGLDTNVALLRDTVVDLRDDISGYNRKIEGTLNYVDALSSELASTASGVRNMSEEVKQQTSSLGDRILAKLESQETAINNLSDLVKSLDKDVQGLKEQVATLKASPLPPVQVNVNPAPAPTPGDPGNVTNSESPTKEEGKPSEPTI